MVLDRIIELLAKRLGGAASEDEAAELYELIKQNPEHHYLVEIIEAIDSKKSASLIHESEEQFVKKNWGKLQDKLQSEEVKTFDDAHQDSPKLFLFRRSFQLAAIWIAVVAALSICVYLSSNHNWFSNKNIAFTTGTHQIEIPYGVLGKQVLPDGSEVWMNSGSHIRYSDDGKQNTRDVYLEGEAYFKVKHDATHPFIVHAGNISVKALGTEFNVQAYPDEKTIRTTLVNGKVQITMAEKPDQNIILVPNEKLTVTSNEQASPLQNQKKIKQFSYEVEQITKASSATKTLELAWMQDELSFQNESFAEVAKKMERRYNVHIIFNNTSLQDENLTGTFKNESVEKALRIIQMTTTFRYQMRNDSVFINQSNGGKQIP
jgi:transmembrane sensor